MMASNARMKICVWKTLCALVVNVVGSTRHVTMGTAVRWICAMLGKAVYIFLSACFAMMVTPALWVMYVLMVIANWARFNAL